MNNPIVQKEVFHFALVLKRCLSNFNACIILEQIFQCLETDGFSSSFSETEQRKTTFFRGSFHSYNDEPAEQIKQQIFVPILGLTTILIKKYYRVGKLHRKNDLPAITDSLGEFYYIDGLAHREGDKPAYISHSGKCRKWFYRGKLHRANGLPALIDNNNFAYYVNGILHRENDLPAVISDNGSCMKWYIKGTLHREKGPAIIEGRNFEYYINGLKHRENDLPASVDNDGNRMRWFCHGKLHRENNLPAVIDLQYNHYAVGLCLRWLKNGKHHRSDGGPSYVSPNEMIFYSKGIIHRLDGPAIIRFGEVVYFRNGKIKSKMPLDEYMKIAPNKDILYIKAWNCFTRDSRGNTVSSEEIKILNTVLLEEINIFLPETKLCQIF